MITRIIFGLLLSSTVLFAQNSTTHGNLLRIPFDAVQINPADSPASRVFTTNCHQTFHFFFLSQGSPTFWIGEDLSGECNFSRLIHISVNDSAAYQSESRLKSYQDWGDVPDLKDLFETYKEQPLELKDKIWQNEEIKVHRPAYDPFLAEEFNEHIANGGSNAVTWLKLKGSAGIKLPTIEGINTEYVFSYQSGLYINYEIAEVHYFPGRYILIFTHQPQKAVGSDTMHGFLIFKINKG